MLISMLNITACVQEATHIPDPEKDKEFAEYIFSQIEEAEKKEEQKNALKELQKTTQGTMKIFAQAIEEKDYDKFASVVLTEYCKETLSDKIIKYYGTTEEWFAYYNSHGFQFKEMKSSYIVNSSEELKGTTMEEFYKDVFELYGISEDKIEAIAFQEYAVMYDEEDSTKKIYLVKSDGAWYVMLI